MGNPKIIPTKQSDAEGQIIFCVLVISVLDIERPSNYSFSNRCQVYKVDTYALINIWML